MLRYRYDLGGRLCRLEQPDDVAEERSSDGAILFERDQLGRVLKATVEEPEGRDVVTAFERDDIGRIVAETTRPGFAPNWRPATRCHGGRQLARAQTA